MKILHDQNNLSRREFLTKGSVGLGCLGFLGMSNNFALQEATTHTTENKKEVLCRTLGRTGIQIPIVGMGVMNSSLKDLVMESYKVGVRHFDTAWNYQQGRNETMVGDAIRQLGVRNQVVIGTKILLPDPRQTELTPEKTKEVFLERFAESLSRLQMDYVDILYFHSMYDPQHLNASPILEAFTELKRQKKIRFAGFSCHTNMTVLLNEAAKSDFYDVALISFNYAMADDKEYYKAMEKAASKGIGLVAMKTQCQQGWYKYNLPTEQKRFYEGKIMHSALLKWVLRHEFITTAIPGYTTYEQMNTDFPVAYDLTYSQEEKKFLEDRNIKTSLKSCCRQCYSCVSTCPKSVDIPALIRAHMYAAHYSNFYQSRDTIDEIQKGKGLSACAECTACTARCANRVDIHGKIEELKLIYV